MLYEVITDFEMNRFALYGEVTAALSDRLRLRTGLRVERHESDYSDSDLVEVSPSDSMLGGRAVLEADVFNDVMLYASASRGYKAGGFNTSGTLDPQLRQYFV